MSAPPQLDRKPPPSVPFMLAWLLPLADPQPPRPPQDYVALKRWAAGAPLPYRFVSRVAGPLTDEADYPTLRIHTLATTDTAAYREGQRTDERLMVLDNYPNFAVNVGGRLVHCDWIEITEAAHEEPYGAESVVTRMVTECKLCLPFVAA